MTDSPDITEVKECFRAGDDAKLLDAFQRFIASDKWPTSCHKWGEENAEEFSAFIQHIVPLLPVSTPVDVVGELCRNYMLGLAQVPQSIDIAAKVFVDFWKLIQSLGKSIYADRWKIRKNMSSSLVLLTSKDHSCAGKLNKLPGIVNVRKKTTMRLVSSRLC